MKEEVIVHALGNVWKVLVKAGGQVKSGDVLFSLEILKTDVPHMSTTAETVSAVNITEGQEGIDPGIVAVEIG